MTTEKTHKEYLNISLEREFFLTDEYGNVFPCPRILTAYELEQKENKLFLEDCR